MIKLILGLVLVISSVQNSFLQGQIEGTLNLDSVWAPMAYLSLIPDFEDMNSMSYNMIIETAKIDSQGNFSFKTDYLPVEDHLYRIHVSRKDDSPISIIIGGKEENHFFLIANSQSNVVIKSGDSISFLNGLAFEGYQPNKAVQEINTISNYLDSTDLEDTRMKREFIYEAVNEKLRIYADSCSHPLVSLYALYSCQYGVNLSQDEEYFSNYLNIWKKDKSEYFKALRKQFPVSNKPINAKGLGIAVLFFSLGFGASLLVRRTKKKKKLRWNSLTVQERKIFTLIQEGKSNKEIADGLNIELSTVKTHVNNLYSKLQIKSRKEGMSFVNN